jgi:hypothetical protein
MKKSTHRSNSRNGDLQQRKEVALSISFKQMTIYQQKSNGSMLNTQTLANVALLDDVFHERIGQHYQFYFYNRQHSLKYLIEQDRISYISLNDANILLGKFCRRVIEGLKPSNDDQSAVLKELVDTLQKWRGLYKAGGAFDTYQFASKIFADLGLLNVQISRQMGEYPSLIDAFLRVPVNIKFFFQYNLLITYGKKGSTIC